MSKQVFSVGPRGVVLDDAVTYMDVDVAGNDWRMARATYEAVSNCGDAISVFFRVMLHDRLPQGLNHLPLDDDGPFADAARLDGRWREAVAARA